jgi:hypothetical protein
MDYCGPLGIEYEDFLRWSRFSRDAAITWRMRERATCQGCGTRPEEWDPEQGGHPSAYAPAHHRCPGCAALQAAREVDEKSTAPRRRGVTIRLEPRETRP